MSWHPVRKIIAIGWTSGELNMWNEHDHDLHEVYSIHKSNITVIKWSHNGQKIVTADQVGMHKILEIICTHSFTNWSNFFCKSHMLHCTMPSC